MNVRHRRADDIAACVEILEGTAVADGYPLNRRDVRDSFVVRKRELGAWVAEIDNRVVGHVSIQWPDDWLTYQVVRDVTGLTADEVSILSALFVSVEYRGRAVGRGLIDHAVQASRAMGRHPALDVGKTLTSAVAVYEAARWRRIGEIAFAIGDVPVESWVYLAPDSLPFSTG